MNTCILCGGAYGDCNIPGLVKCISCGFVTANLSLTSDEIKQIYGRRYFHGEEYADYIADRQVIERHFRTRLNTLVRFVSEPGTKHLLEIGCAYGFFLNVASGIFATVEGIDISTDAIAFAREQNLSVSEQDFLDYAPLYPPDIICMWDTIEHLAHPVAYIDAAARLLPRGGVLAITTGDIESFVARVRGARWRQIHPPSHLHYFAKGNLTELLQRRGFAVRYAGSDGQLRSLETIAYVVLMIKHHQPSLYKALKRTGLLKFAIYLNLFDIMYLIAEKTA